MFCNNCGKEVKENAVICNHCGCRVEVKLGNELEANDPSAFTYICIIMIFAAILWAVYENIRAGFLFGL